MVPKDISNLMLSSFFKSYITFTDNPGKKQSPRPYLLRVKKNVTPGFTVQNKKSQIVLNTSINSSSYVSFSILPMIYQYFWRVRLAKNKPE